MLEQINSGRGGFTLYGAEWQKPVTDVGSIIRGQEPVTFFIGAGASISSGAPTTQTVCDALIAANPGRFPDEVTLRTGIHHLTEPEKRAALSPLFDDLMPYLGYRSMAALARTRPVYVINLNWDNCIERAASSVGVEITSTTLEDSADDIRKAFGIDKGIACLHIHGRFDQQIRFGIFEMLSIEQEKKELIKDLFAHPTVFIGTSFALEGDVHELLDELIEQSNPHHNPRWLFTRREISDQNPYRALFGEYNVVSNPCVDFDALLVNLLAEVSDHHFQETIDQFRNIRLPHPDQFVPTRPELLRNVIDGRVIALIGEPYLGKTTAAVHLAHFLKSLDPDLDIDSVEGFYAEAQLARLRPEDPTILILGDPFGETSTVKPRPGILELLSQISKEDGRSRVILTSRLQNWHQVVDDGKWDLNAVNAAAVPTEAWYAQIDLENFVRKQTRSAPTRIIGEIRNELLKTPSHVKGALEGDRDWHESAVDKSQYLRMHSDEGLLACLVRLQEFADRTISFPELLLAVGTDCRITDRLDMIIHIYEWDEQRWAVLAHSTDVEAVDQLLVDPGELIHGRLSLLAEGNDWVDESWSRWRAKNSIRSGDAAAALKSMGDHGIEFAPTLLAEAARDEALTTQVLNWLPGKKLDFWTRTLLAYEMVKHWPSIGSNDVAQQLLESFLGDRERFGTYCVMEAALYCHYLAPREIWDRVGTGVWDLVRTRERYREELELIVDGLLWRTPPEDQLGAVELLEAILEGTPLDDPSRGAYDFAALYHPAELLGTVTERTGWHPLAQDTAPTLDQKRRFVGLLQWHFVHQSRVRATLHRRRWDQELAYTRRRLLRDVVPYELADRREKARWWLRQLGEHKEFVGWGIHLAMNMQTTFGDLELSDDVTELIDRAEPGDIGLVTAAATYDPSRDLIPELQKYFEHPDSREALLDTFSGGAFLQGVNAEPPRFQYVANPWEVEKVYGIHWPALQDLQIFQGDGEKLISRLEQHKEKATSRFNIDAGVVDEVLKRAKRGNLALLEKAAYPRRAEASDYPHEPNVDDIIEVIGSAALALQTDQSQLF